MLQLNCNHKRQGPWGSDDRCQPLIINVSSEKSAVPAAPATPRPLIFHPDAGPTFIFSLLVCNHRVKPRCHHVIFQKGVLIDGAASRRCSRKSLLWDVYENNFNGGERGDSADRTDILQLNGGGFDGLKMWWEAAGHIRWLSTLWFFAVCQLAALTEKSFIIFLIFFFF